MDYFYSSKTGTYVVGYGDYIYSTYLSILIIGYIMMLIFLIMTLGLMRSSSMKSAVRSRGFYFAFDKFGRNVKYLAALRFIAW